MLSRSTTMPVQRIRFWQHGRAVRQMSRAYPPGVDAQVDRIRSAGLLTRFALQQLLLPLYFPLEQGWAVPAARGGLAGMIDLRRKPRQGLPGRTISNIILD